MTTSIEWAANQDGSPGETWNPTKGCRHKSPGCKFCYAETFAERWRGIPGHPYEHGFDPRLAPEHLDKPLRKKKPTTYFVDSMSDLFLEDFPNEYIAAVFGVMAACPQHRFILLTKRAERLPEWFAWVQGGNGYRYNINAAFRSLVPGKQDRAVFPTQAHGMVEDRPWPLPNLWLGVSVENRRHGVPRIDLLRQVPAAVRVLSIEPLLKDLGELDLAGIGWGLIGGESGAGARPMHLNAARGVVRQFQAKGIPVFVKQLGQRPQADYYDDDGDSEHFAARGHDWTADDEVDGLQPPPGALVTLKFGKKQSAHLEEMPPDLRVREFPEVSK